MTSEVQNPNDILFHFIVNAGPDKHSQKLQNYDISGATTAAALAEAQSDAAVTQQSGYLIVNASIEYSAAQINCKSLKLMFSNQYYSNYKIFFIRTILNTLLALK